MQIKNPIPVAQTIRELKVGESVSWPIERNLTVRNAASQIMLRDPSKEIRCNQNRKVRTITATRIH